MTNGVSDAILLTFPNWTAQGVAKHLLTDTIIARASAPGSAIRGILRISGRQAVSVVKTIVEEPDALILAQRATCVDTRIVLLRFPPFPAKLLLWKEGHSYTGDEAVEIHTIGSPVLLDAIMTALLAVSEEVRLAHPGEFTLRAFLSGRLDLPKAEAVLGVIDATDNADLKTALHQLAGNVSAPLSAVRMLLFETLVQLEAALDFADEDIPVISEQELQRTLSDASEQIDQLRKRIVHRGIAEGKPKIVLVGSPNVGKSTLFNKLVQKDAALVSPLAGTTRDYLEAEINWNGIPVVLMDTAGIGGEAMDESDKSAQTQVHELLKIADVIVYCCEDLSHTATQKNKENLPLGACVPWSEKTITFQTKTANDPLESLIKEVSTLLRRSPEYGMLPSTALRCRESLIVAGDSLNRAQSLADPTLIALEIRNAVNRLGLIDGTVHTEDILDNIFSRFCVGK